MPGATTKYGVPYPLLSDPADIETDGVKDTADAIDVLLAPSTQGVLASRPAFGKSGRTYFATDTGQLFRDNGASWDELAVVPSAAQTWQTINLAQFQSNGPLSYYKDPLRIVHLRGELFTANVGSPPGAGATLCTLPAGYRPGVATRLLLIGEDGSFPRLNLTTAGVLTTIPALGSGISYSFGLCHFRAEN